MVPCPAVRPLFVSPITHKHGIEIPLYLSGELSKLLLSRLLQTDNRCRHETKAFIVTSNVSSQHQLFLLNLILKVSRNTFWQNLSRNSIWAEICNWVCFEKPGPSVLFFNGPVNVSKQISWPWLNQDGCQGGHFLFGFWNLVFDLQTWNF